MKAASATAKPVRVLFAQRPDLTDDEVLADHGYAPGTPVVVMRTKDCRRLNESDRWRSFSNVTRRGEVSE